MRSRLPGQRRPVRRAEEDISAVAASILL